MCLTSHSNWVCPKPNPGLLHYHTCSSCAPLRRRQLHLLGCSPAATPLPLSSLLHSQFSGPRPWPMQPLHGEATLAFCLDHYNHLLFASAFSCRFPNQQSWSFSMRSQTRSLVRSKPSPDSQLVQNEGPGCRSDLPGLYHPYPQLPLPCDLWLLPSNCLTHSVQPRTCSQHTRSPPMLATPSSWSSCPPPALTPHSPFPTSSVAMALSNNSTHCNVHCLVPILLEWKSWEGRALLEHYAPSCAPPACHTLGIQLQLLNSLIQEVFITYFFSLLSKREGDKSTMWLSATLREV